MPDCQTQVGFPYEISAKYHSMSVVFRVIIKDLFFEEECFGGGGSVSKKRHHDAQDAVVSTPLSISSTLLVQVCGLCFIDGTSQLIGLHSGFEA